MKQSPHSGAAAESLGLLLLRDTRALVYEQLLEGIEGLDVTLFPVLDAVARLGPATATAIGLATGLDRTVATRYAARLVDAGLLLRGMDSSDFRAAPLELTTAGKAAVRKSRRRMTRLLEEFLAPLSAKDARRFADLLDGLAGHLRGS